MMKITKYILITILALMASTVSAEDRNYLFDIKLFDITDVADGVQKYQTLEPFSNPKMLTRENVAAVMKLSGDNQKELNFELKVLARSKRSFDIEFKLFKGEELVSGPILTEGFLSDKTWLMVTNFDGRKLVVTAEMSSIDENK